MNNCRSPIWSNYKPSNAILIEVLGMTQTDSDNWLSPSMGSDLLGMNSHFLGEIGVCITQQFLVWIQRDTWQTYNMLHAPWKYIASHLLDFYLFCKEACNSKQYMVLSSIFLILIKTPSSMQIKQHNRMKSDPPSRHNAFNYVVDVDIIPYFNPLVGGSSCIPGHEED